MVDENVTSQKEIMTSRQDSVARRIHAIHQPRARGGMFNPCVYLHPGTVFSNRLGDTTTAADQAVVREPREACCKCTARYDLLGAVQTKVPQGLKPREW